MFPRDFVLSTVLAFGERVAERIFLPGLHRSASRVVDPARIDTLSALAADAIALLILICKFLLVADTDHLFTQHRINPYVTALVGGGLMIVVFIGSTAEWFEMLSPN